MSMSPDGTQLVRSEASGAIRGWRLTNGTLKPAFASVGRFELLRFTSDGKHILSWSRSSDPSHPDLVDVLSKKTLLSSKDLPRGAFSSHVSADGRYLAIGHPDGKVDIWDMNNSILVHKLTAHPDGRRPKVLALVFSASARVLASAGRDNSVRIWDVASGKRRFTFKNGYSFGGIGLTFSADGKLLAGAGPGSRILVWNVSTGQVHVTIPWTEHRVCSITISPDGKLLAAADDEGHIKLWTLR
jgi:WD40 repeat protein